MGPFLCPFLMGFQASSGGVGETETGAGCTLGEGVPCGAQLEHAVPQGLAGGSHLMWLMMRFVGGMKKSSTPAKGVWMRCWPWPVLASVITYNTEPKSL